MKGEPFYTMGFYVALLFLTRIPLPQVKLDENKIASSLPFFSLQEQSSADIDFNIHIRAENITGTSCSGDYCSYEHNHHRWYALGRFRRYYGRTFVSETGRKNLPS